MCTGTFNTDSIKLVFMLISICVVACFFIRSYARGRDVLDNNTKVQRIHTFYVCGILVFIIIELVTSLCMDNVKHAEILNYISFAATLSSLIMSIVAIIFTIVTSNRGDEQYKKIDNASDRVTDSLNKFTEKTSDIDKTVEEFKTIAKDLSSQMDGLYKEMGGTHEDVSEVKRMLSEQQGHNDSVSPKGGEKKGDNHKFLNIFVATSSFSGDIALYACVLAKDKGISFSLKQITQQDVSYKYGFLIAAISAGVISGTVSPDKCSITDYLPGLKERVISAIDNYIGRQVDTEAKTRLQNLKTSVESIFI